MNKNIQENNIQKRGGEIYKCSECGMSYKEKQWRDKCQAWCQEHEKNCNVKIASHAIEKPVAEDSGRARHGSGCCG